jgi:hypothetical protein
MMHAAQSGYHAAMKVKFAPGCLVLSIVLSLVATLLVNVLIRALS